LPFWLLCPHRLSLSFPVVIDCAACPGEVVTSPRPRLRPSLPEAPVSSWQDWMLQPRCLVAADVRAGAHPPLRSGAPPRRGLVSGGASRAA